MQFSRWNLNITCTCNKAILKLMISAFWFDSFEISLLDAYVKKQPVYDAEQIFALACINEFDCNIKELSTKIHFKVNDAFIKQYSDVRCFIKGWIQTLLREIVKLLLGISISRHKDCLDIKSFRIRPFLKKFSHQNDFKYFW